MLILQTILLALKDQLPPHIIIEISGNYVAGYHPYKVDDGWHGLPLDILFEVNEHHILTFYSYPHSVVDLNLNNRFIETIVQICQQVIEEYETDQKP